MIFGVCSYCGSPGNMVFNLCGACSALKVEEVEALRALERRWNRWSSVVEAARSLGALGPRTASRDRALWAKAILKVQEAVAEAEKHQDSP